MTSSKVKCPDCGKSILMPRFHGAMWRFVEEALSVNGWSRVKTAEDLGLNVKTIRRWISQYREAGLDIPDDPNLPIPIPCNFEKKREET